MSLEKNEPKANTVQLNKNSYQFEIVNEDDLTWQQHNHIHRTLNVAYHQRTHAFIKKTFAHAVPIKRILCTLKGALVGHTAIFQDYILENQKIAGIGLTCSLRPLDLLGHELRKQANHLCKEEGYLFAVGRVRNTPRIKKNLSDLVVCFIDIPLIGTSTTSHPWETLAIYSAGNTKEQIQPFVDYFKQAGYIKIEGEIF